uniref:Uncharacterized protein isoform X1 n=2 Tax=Pogona vitticeps TaxID=103695 RepID=A0ABM5GF79_9SAUR
MFGKTYDLGRRSRKRHSGEVEVQKGGHERGGEATKMCWEISSQEDWSESSKKMKAVKMSMLGAFPLLLYICLLSVGLCQKELQNQIQEWNYREGADKVNIQGIKSITRVLEKWANSIFWQTKHSLLSHPNVLLPELSSLQPVSEAIDNLLKQVNSMKKRLAELNERLNVISRALFPIRYKALRSQRLSSIYLRNRPVKRNGIYVWRRTRRN